VAAIAVVLIARYGGVLLVVARPVDQPDAILSLASHEWERLPATAELASQYPSAVVLLTLPQPATPDNCHDCSGRVGRLRRLGVAADRIRILPLTAPGTYGEALATLAFSRQEEVHRLLVVTTPYHTRRSLAVFRAVFDGHAVQVGVEPARTSPARPDRWWGNPYDLAYVAYEWTAALYYAARYGVVIWR